VARTLGIGIVGASGAFGRFIASAIAELPDVALIAVSGSHPARTEQAARDLSVTRWFTDYSEFLTQPDIDIVVISTPPALHAPMAIQAMRAGKAVFLEKPAATSYEQGRELLLAQRDTGARVLVDFVMRYNPLYTCLHEIATRRIFGEPRRIDFTNNAGDEALPPDHWFWDRRQSGGIFIEHGVHFFDAYGWITGALPRHVTGTTTTRHGTDQQDKVLATVVYENDSLGSYYHAFDKPSGLERQIGLLAFDRGYARLDGWIAMDLDIEGLVNEEESEALGRMGFALNTAERYTGVQTRRRGNGLDYTVTRHMTGTLRHTEDKERVYLSSVRDALNDLVSAVRDLAHRQQVTLWDGVLSSAIACAASHPGDATRFTDEVAWLTAMRP